MAKASKKILNNLIDRIYHSYKNLNDGALASYIPELAKADAKKFGISITTLDGETICVGDFDTSFTIQSISKPFVFGLAIETHGIEHVRSRVDVEPTGDSFHSIIHLDNESKRPSNPMVNTGAIAMTSLIKGKSKKEGQLMLQKYFEKFTGCSLEIDESVYESEKATGHRNRAMAHLMLHFGMVEPEIDETVDLYFRQCSFKVNTNDLSMMAATLANNGINPKTKEIAIKKENINYLLTLMFTCGLYTYAGQWAFNVGIPAKSGVSGGILAVVPGEMGIGVYSPLVDLHGNSVRGLRFFNDFSKELNLHVFKQY